MMVLGAVYNHTKRLCVRFNAREQSLIGIGMKKYRFHRANLCKFHSIYIICNNDDSVANGFDLAIVHVTQFIAVILVGIKKITYRQLFSSNKNGKSIGKH